MDFRWTYLLLSGLFLAIWLVFFLIRKDLRRELLLISIAFAIPGLLSDIIYTVDWWSPATVTGTRVGVESVITGFALAGIAAVLYSVVFQKRERRLPNRKPNLTRRHIILPILLAVIFFGAFFLFRLNTFWATTLAFSIPTIILWIQRPDLIKDSLMTGLLLLTVAIVVYSILELLTPGWVQEFWYFRNVPNIVILSVPVDDWLWYFFAGAFIGPLYEYYYSVKLVDRKKKEKK